MLLMLAGASPVSNKSSSQPRPKTIPLGTMKNSIDTVSMTRIASRRTRCVVGARSRRAYAIIGAAGSARSSPVRLAINWKSTLKVRRDRIELLFIYQYRYKTAHRAREGVTIALCYRKSENKESVLELLEREYLFWFAVVKSFVYKYFVICVYLT